MRRTLPDKLEAGRVRVGLFASDPSWGPYGKFLVQGPCGAKLMIIANGADHPEADGFEHVSVSLLNRCPNWPEMSFVKNLFWKDSETVFEFHPSKATYVSNHPFCLHMWRDTLGDPRLPNPLLVGFVGRGEMSNEERYAACLEIIRKGKAK